MKLQGWAELRTPLFSLAEGLPVTQETVIVGQLFAHVLESLGCCRPLPFAVIFCSPGEVVLTQRSFLLVSRAERPWLGLFTLREQAKVPPGNSIGHTPSGAQD